MATTTLISVQEYLRTSYRPDCDYIDGQVEERNMGEKPHARLQSFLCWFLRNHEDVWQIEVLTEQRLQITATRFRIPDILLTPMYDPEPKIVRTAPILCIEILSSEDRMRKVQERLDDYAVMGVQTLWVIDPWRGTAHQAGGDGHLRVVEDRLTAPGTKIGIDVAVIFDELDRLEKRAADGPPKS